jgi:hypothetical protein
VPQSWKSDLQGDAVELLPLVTDVKEHFEPGWCTYVRSFDSPEMEVFCGGLNSKIASAAAIWRQGNLLHFGFEPSPAALNETGRALLVNAVVYISRFTEDRPIPRTPSPFEGVEATTRAQADRLLRQPKPSADYLTWYFSPAARQAGNTRDMAAFKKWYRENRSFLRDDPKTGKLTLDAEAKALGVGPASPEFFARAGTLLAEGGAAADRARRLLRRYAPEGPASGDGAAWRAWWERHRPYLFFSDSGGYRWYVDPLALKRKVPTAQLRGPRRATVR